MKTSSQHHNTMLDLSKHRSKQFTKKEANKKAMILLIGRNNSIKSPIQIWIYLQVFDKGIGGQILCLAPALDVWWGLHGLHNCCFVYYYIQVQAMLVRRFPVVDSTGELPVKKLKSSARINRVSTEVKNSSLSKYYPQRQKGMVKIPKRAFDFGLAIYIGLHAWHSHTEVSIATVCYAHTAY